MADEVTMAPDGSVQICLLCDPDLPADIAGRLCGDLPTRLQRQVSRSVRWEVRRVVAPLVGDEQLAVSDLQDLLGENLQDDAWDVGVFITDLPRRSEVRPVAAEVAVRERIALVSLPALGPLRVYARTRGAVVRLVAELVQGDHDPETPLQKVAGPRRDKRRRLPTAAIDPLRPDPVAGGVRALGSRWLGWARMVGGMVRANRPWRLFRGLSHSLAGVFATAAYAMINVTAWRVSASLGPLRQSLLCLGALAALIAWLVLDHELWERAPDKAARRRARLYNLSTLLTLALGVALLYTALFTGLIAVQQLLVTSGVLRSYASLVPSWPTNFAIVWFATSGAIIGGAIGSGFDDDTAVRRATYGQRQRERRQCAAAEKHD